MCFTIYYRLVLGLSLPIRIYCLGISNVDSGRRYKLPIEFSPLRCLANNRTTFETINNKYVVPKSYKSKYLRLF